MDLTPNLAKKPEKSQEKVAETAEIPKTAPNPAQKLEKSRQRPGKK